jgi:hypothetical protein
MDEPINARLCSGVAGFAGLALPPLVPGKPASGTKVALDMSKYTTLTEEQKEKVRQVLEKKRVSGARISRRTAGGASQVPGASM